MHPYIHNWLVEIFSALNASADNFAGLGLIFYEPPLALPILSLAPQDRELDLPASSIAASIALLSKVSRAGSPFHDGFHMVNANNLQVTQVSQFFAPPIPSAAPRIDVDHPIGARFMAAYLGSMMPTVALIATLSKREGGLIFMNGTIQPILKKEE